MKINNEKVLANFLEKFLVFGAQSMGKPIILDGGTVLIRNFSKWRLAIVASVLIAILSSYINGFPWFLSVGLLVSAFLILSAFFFL